MHALIYKYKKVLKSNLFLIENILNKKSIFNKLKKL